MCLPACPSVLLKSSDLYTVYGWSGYSGGGRGMCGRSRTAGTSNVCNQPGGIFSSCLHVDLCVYQLINLLCVGGAAKICAPPGGGGRGGGSAAGASNVCFPPFTHTHACAPALGSCGSSSSTWAITPSLPFSLHNPAGHWSRDCPNKGAAGGGGGGSWGGNSYVSQCHNVYDT